MDQDDVGLLGKALEPADQLGLGRLLDPLAVLQLREGERSLGVARVAPLPLERVGEAGHGEAIDVDER